RADQAGMIGAETRVQIAVGLQPCQGKDRAAAILFANDKNVAILGDRQGMGFGSSRAKVDHLAAALAEAGINRAVCVEALDIELIAGSRGGAAGHDNLAVALKRDRETGVVLA